MLVGPYGGISRQATETGSHFMFSERVAYLSKSDRFIWIEHQHQTGTQILSEKETIAGLGSMTGNLIIPSPDERYIAVAGNGMELWVYDTKQRTWVDLGKATIHPASEWDYIKPSWSPWFADSSRLVFFSGSVLIVASPDGKNKTTLITSENAGLPLPSPDGKQIAYVSFIPRYMKVRPDLKLWGGTTIWTIAANGKGKPRQLTLRNDDTTYDLKWAGNDRLVFDRIADQTFYAHARVWTVGLPDGMQ